MAALIPHQTRHHVRIHAAPLVVWRALTTPELVTRWMGEPSIEGDTDLTVTLTGFATESIFKHLDFYWRGTVGVLKRHVESR